jgi:hypothetical protein
MSETPRDREDYFSPFLPLATENQLNVIRKANEVGWLAIDDPLSQLASRMHEEMFSGSEKPSPEEVADSATQLFIEVWLRVVTDEEFDDRTPIEDASLELRDTLNPSWPSDSDWLPEELKLRLDEFYSSNG